MKTNALATAANALAVTTSLLAISIEACMIVGGFYIYRRAKAELTEAEKPQAILSVNGELPVITEVPKPTLKEKLAKAKKIIKAVIE